MAEETSLPSGLDPREVYHLRTVQILDDWKSGKISSTEAHQNHDDAIAVMVHELYNSWHTRMSVLDAWCTTHPVAPRRRAGA